MNHRKPVSFKCFIILFFLFGLSNVWDSEPAEFHSQSEQQGNTELRADKSYWKGYVADTKEIAIAPFRRKNNNYIKLSLVAGITAGLYLADDDIRDWVQENRNSTSEDISEFFEHFGDGKYTLPPLAALYAYGHYYKHEQSRKTALLSLESFVITGIFTQALKFSLHRHRPVSGDSYDTWDGPGISGSNLSFPSGHSSSVFSIATVIASEYKENVLVPPLAYGIASLTALSRVHDDKHWASDIFAGSALGYFTAKAVIKLHDKDKANNISLYPVTKNGQTAIMVSYKY